MPIERITEFTPWIEHRGGQRINEVRRPASGRRLREASATSGPLMQHEPSADGATKTQLAQLLCLAAITGEDFPDSDLGPSLAIVGRTKAEFLEAVAKISDVLVDFGVSVLPTTGANPTPSQKPAAVGSMGDVRGSKESIHRGPVRDSKDFLKRLHE